MYKAFGFTSTKKKASEPLGGSDRWDPTNALAEVPEESLAEVAEAPPPLLRGNTKLRTPYEVHGYKLTLSLNERPAAPLFLSIRSGAGVWSTAVAATALEDAATPSSAAGRGFVSNSDAATTSAKDKAAFAWPHERLSLRLMHPSQDLAVQLFTMRNGTLQPVVLGQGCVRGLMEHPAIGAERTVTVRLRAPLKQQPPAGNAGDRIVSLFSASKPLPSSSQAKVGSLTLKVYFLAPDDFSVAIVDLHAPQGSTSPRRAASVSPKAASPLSPPDAPLPLDLPRAVAVHDDDDASVEVGAATAGTAAGLSTAVSVAKGGRGSAAGKLFGAFEVESAGEEAEAAALDDEDFAALEQAREEALLSRLAEAFEAEAPTSASPPAATTRLALSPLAPLVAPGSANVPAQATGTVSPLLPSSPRSGSGAALARRAELLVAAAAALERRGVVGVNVKQSLGPLLRLAVAPGGSGRFVAWLEDLVWDLADLGGASGLQAFHEVYGPPRDYPVCPRPLASVAALLPNLTTHDVQPLTFGLKANTADGTSSLALRAESAADYVRWTAAIATYLGGAADPFLGPAGRETVPRYCRVGSVEGRALEMGLLGGDEEDDEEGRPPAVVAGWLLRKKQHRSRVSSTHWVRRHFTLRAHPAADARRSEASAAGAQQTPAGDSSSSSSGPAVVAWLEWTHSDRKRGIASVALDPASLALVEPCAPTARIPPGYLIDINVVAVRGLALHTGEAARKGASKKGSKGASKPAGRPSAADSHTAAIAAKGAAASAGPAAPFAEEPLGEAAPWLVVRRSSSGGGDALELRTPPAETVRTRLVGTETDGGDGLASTVLLFRASTEVVVPVEGAEAAAADGPGADGAPLLETRDTLVVALFRKSAVRGGADVCLGSAKLKLDQVPMDRRRHVAVPLLELLAGGDARAANEAAVSASASVSQTGPSVVATVHLTLEARRLRPCLTKWPCAWVNLLDSTDAADAASLSQPRTTDFTRQQLRPLPLSLACSLPLNASSPASPASPDGAAVAPSLVCQPAPEALLLFRSSNGASAQGTSVCWLRVPWECVADLLVASPGCVHLHLSARHLSEAVRRRFMGADGAELRHEQDVGKCAMEEKVRNTVIRAKQNGVAYPAWLVKCVGEGDYDAEFVSGMRRNDKWHARWEAYGRDDLMTFAFSDEATLEVDMAKVNEAVARPHKDAWESRSGDEEAVAAQGNDLGGRARQASFGDLQDDLHAAPAPRDAAATALPALPPELAAWLSDGGEVVLRIAPCPAAALAACVRERLDLHGERRRLNSVVKLPDWAHFEVAEVTCAAEGKVGVAVDTLAQLQAKQAQLSDARPRVGAASSFNIVGRVNSVAGLLPLVFGPAGATAAGDVFDSSFVELFRLKLYTRRLYDSRTYPVWRRGGHDFRAYVHLRMGQALRGDEGIVAQRQPAAAAAAALAGRGLKLLRASNARGEYSESSGSSSEDDEGFSDGPIANGGQGNEVSRLQLAASDGVAKTVQSVDRLLACLGRLLGEVALAFPDQRTEFLRHAQLLVEAVYIVVVSEVGRHIGSAEAIRKVTMQALLMLLDLLLKRNRCVEEVLSQHGLSGGAAVELTAMLEAGPLLSRFTNRTVLEMVQFAQRTVHAYEGMVAAEAQGPCYESPLGKMWSRCPEDLMSVTNMYVSSVAAYCKGLDSVLGKVLASVLSAHLIHAKSIGKQYDAIARAFYTARAKQPVVRGKQSGPSLAGLHLRSFLGGKSGGGSSEADTSATTAAAAWSGELSIQYLCAVINDCGRVINGHLATLLLAHEATMTSEGLVEGVLEVQDVFFAMGNRGAALLARLLVDGLNLESHVEVAWACSELVEGLLGVSKWLDDAPFFPRLVAAAADNLAAAYLFKLAIALDPAVASTAAGPSWATGTASSAADFFGAAQKQTLAQDVSALSEAFAAQWPHETSKSFDELRETQQILSLELASPTEDAESFEAAVQVLVGVVRTHPTSLHGRLVKFVQICLNARADVNAATADAAVSSLVAHLEECNRGRQPTRPREGRADLFTLLFDDGADGDDDKRNDSRGPEAASRPAAWKLGSLFQVPRTRPLERGGSFASLGLDRLPTVALRASEGSAEDEAAGRLGKSPLRGKSVPRGGSASTKETLRAVVKRYAQPGEAAKAWRTGDQGRAVDDIVSGRVKGRRAAWALEVDVIEATSLPPHHTLKCTVRVGGEALDANAAKATRAQGGRVMWRDRLTFDKVYNLYGTDLTLVLAYKGPQASGSNAAVEDTLTVPLASLDADSALDDWYLLSNSDGMVRLRLVLKLHAHQQQ